MKRRTIDEKIEDAFGDHPYTIKRGDVLYNLYDTTRSELQAGLWKSQIEHRTGYVAHIDQRLVDDIMHGKWWYVYDVYIRKVD
jgi:hypothetical protein